MRIPKKVPSRFIVTDYFYRMRLELGISERKFATEAGISRTTIFNWGESLEPADRGVWLKIVDAYQRLKAKK